MRLAVVPASVHIAVGGPRRTRSAGRSAPLSALGPNLPHAVADRLAGVMAQDPGLAEAVKARLPKARAESARDLAAYASPAPASSIDIRS